MTGLVLYKSTPVIDESKLPAGLRRAHRIKAGVWGVINVCRIERTATFGVENSINGRLECWRIWSNL